MQNIPLFKIYSDQDDLEAVTSVITRGTYWANGSEIIEFEEKLADYLKTKYAVSFNSGTSALHTLLLAYGIGKGDEVIVPSFTFISTANAPLLVGAKPVFAEIEDKTYALDPEDVKEKITNKTKAVIPVHYGGAPCQGIKELRKITDDHNILLLEDAAESIGSKIENKMVGSFGHASMFSFCQNKIITAGEGGAIVTDSKDVYEKIKLLRSHGRLEKGEEYFTTTKQLDYIQIGYNYRMPTVSAALVLSQLKKIEKIIKLRREKAKYYNKKLSSIEGISHSTESKNHYHVYQMYTIQLENNINRDKLQENLKKVGIMTKVYFNPIHLTTFYRKKFNYGEGDMPKTEKISKKVLTLPLYPTLKNEEIEFIVDNIKKYCR